MLTDRRVVGVVLAGGLGTRLRSAVPGMPKVMAEVGGRPFIEHLITSLRGQGLREIWLAVAHGAEIIQDYVGDGSALGVKVNYVSEGESLRGTGGALRNAIEAIVSEDRGYVAVFNGDTFVDVELEGMLAFHRDRSAQLTMAVARLGDLTRYGKVQFDSRGRIWAFSEKGSTGPGWINAGCYLAAHDQWLQVLPDEDRYDLERRVLPELVEGRLFAFETRGRFIDIGVPDDYKRAASVLAQEDL